MVDCQKCRLRDSYQNGVPDEEDWGVVAYNVPVSVLCVHLDGEPPRVTSRVGRPTFPTCNQPSKTNLSYPLFDLYIVELTFTYMMLSVSLSHRVHH